MTRLSDSNGLYLCLRGELNGEARELLWELLEPVLDDPQELVFDLSECDYITEEGWGVLVRVYRWRKERLGGIPNFSCYDPENKFAKPWRRLNLGHLIPRHVELAS